MDGGDAKAKICFVGHSSVGKTSIIKTLVEGKFEEAKGPTVSMETTDFEIEANGEKVGLRLCDTQGAEMSQEITQSYFKGMAALIAVYAKDDENSFKEIGDLVDRAFEEVSSSDGIVVVLVGNKSDLKDGVTAEQGKSLVETEDPDDSVADKFFEVSAKSNTNIKEMFTFIAEKILEN